MNAQGSAVVGGVLYEYRCSACGESTVVRFPMGEAPPHVQCPTCALEERTVDLDGRPVRPCPIAKRVFGMPGVKIPSDENFCWREAQRRQVAADREVLTKEYMDEADGFQGARGGTLS